LALGSIVAVVVLVIATSVMMLMRREAVQILPDRRPVPVAPVSTPMAKQEPTKTLTADRGSAAVPFIATSTAKDNPDELYSKGEQYFNGRAVDRDYVKAAEMYRRAADAGHAKAQASLGWMYLQGWGVSRDDTEAVKWFNKAADPIRKAAEQGEAEAQGYLGAMYLNGRGVPKDEAEAVKWIRKSADQGHAQAQYNLGLMYTVGRGVPKDAAEAAKWYRAAAQQGHTEAQRVLQMRGLSW
jgi:uncharacterized protein